MNFGHELYEEAYVTSYTQKLGSPYSLLNMYSGIINTKKQIINKNIGYTSLISHRSSSYIKFILPRHSKNFYKKSPTYRAIYAFNELPKNLRLFDLSFNRFRDKLKSLVNSKGFW